MFCTKQICSVLTFSSTCKIMIWRLHSIVSGKWWHVDLCNTSMFQLLGIKWYATKPEVHKAKKKMRSDLNALLKTSSPEKKHMTKIHFDQFNGLFQRFLTEPQYVEWSKIEQVPDNLIHHFKDLKDPSDEMIKKNLKKLVVVKLNGGLGTSMGCSGPKSLIVVRNNKTFLHLTVQQLVHLNDKYKVSVPLVLMNSFNTDVDTQKILKEYKDVKIEIRSFNQACYPRIHKKTYKPMAQISDPLAHKDAWYPPGHGDFYTSFYHTGLLKEYMKKGREYCFISNIDNLGSTVDMRILNLCINPPDKKQYDFIMELTKKTKADVKGGTIMKYNGRADLLEIAQVPPKHEKEFKDIKMFKYFNTNNLWIKMKAIEAVVKANNLKMEVIANYKEMKDGTAVIQLETAMAAAIKSFKKAVGINVPRKRFLPVKKTSDLLLVLSNIYEVENGTLVMSPKRKSRTTPIIKLSDKHFKKIDKFQKRFKHIPNMRDLEQLTISGDVTFGKNVTLAGKVIIEADAKGKILIADGTKLENKKVTGSGKNVKVKSLK